MECVNCKRMFDAIDLVEIGGNSVCVECKPAVISRMREGTVATHVNSYEYGGFWIRAVALFLDSIFTTLVQLPVTIPLGIFAAMTMDTSSGGDPNFAVFFIVQAINMIVSIGVPLIYSVWFLTKKGATPGKMICGLKVINADGSEKITVGKAIGRHFAYILDALTLCIGYIIAGFDDEKRTLHDRICDTRVVRK